MFPSCCLLSGAPRIEHDLIKAGRRPSIIESGIVEQGTAGLSDSNFTPAGRGGAVFVGTNNSNMVGSDGYRGIAVVSSYLGVLIGYGAPGRVTALKLVQHGRANAAGQRGSALIHNILSKNIAVGGGAAGLVLGIGLDVERVYYCFVLVTGHFEYLLNNLYDLQVNYQRDISSLNVNLI